MLLQEGEDLIAGGLYRHAVGNRLHCGKGDDMPCVHTGLHGGGALRLHAVDLHAGVEQLCQRGNAGGKPAAADGHQNHVHIRQVGENFIGDGALSRGHPQVVEGVDIGQPLLLAEPGGLGGGIVKGCAVDDDVCPVAPCVLHLDEGGSGRHDHRGGHPGLLGGIGNALSVVSGGGGNQPPLLFLLGEGGDGIVSAPNLIGAGHLHVLRLEVDLISRSGGEIGGGDQVGRAEHALQYPAGGLKIVQCHHSAVASFPYHSRRSPKSQRTGFILCPEKRIVNDARRKTGAEGGFSLFFPVKTGLSREKGEK